MNANNIQQEIIRIEKELQNIKNVQRFMGNVNTFSYDAMDTTNIIRIFYDNPTQPPMTILTPSDVDYYIMLGDYDPETKSQQALLQRTHQIVVVTSTQPILKVENVS